MIFKIKSNNENKRLPNHLVLKLFCNNSSGSNAPNEPQVGAKGFSSRIACELHPEQDTVCN